jgi:glycosyltransferase involved in cell wall biosynthesis
MKVLLITRYFPPLDSIASLRMLSWADDFVEQGHEVTILTTSKQGQMMVAMDCDLSRYNVIEVDYFDPLTAFSGDKATALAAASKSRIKGALLRFYRTRLNERIPGRTDLWVFSGLRRLKALHRSGYRPDLIISSYGPPAAHLLGSKAKALFGSTWVADYRDLWIENASYTGLWPFTLLERILERYFVKRADLITTVSDSYRQFLSGKFPDIPVKTVMNGYEPKLIDSVSSDYFSENRKCFRLVYTGALYPKTRDPSPLFAALRALLDRGEIASGDLEVLFFGSVADALPQLIKQYALEDVVRHCGVLSGRDALRVQKSADALLFIEDPSPTIEGVLTGKLFVYLYMSAPILAVGIGPQSAPGRLIGKTASGVACGTDSNLIAQTLVHWLKGERLPVRDRSEISAYSRGAQARILQRAVEGVVR